MAQTASGRIGRPDAKAIEALNRHILSTATRLFIEQGYAATSMEQVATMAGAGKQTIYRRYASKEELFTAVVSALVATLFEAPDEAAVDLTNPLAALRNTCWATLELLLRPEPLALYRILIAEAVRFPSLVERVTRAAVGPVEELVRRLLRAAQEAGQIRNDVPVDDMHHALNGMITGWIVQQRLLGFNVLETEAERRAFFKNAWTLFIRGAAIS